MTDDSKTYVDKMSVSEMKIASICNDLEMLDYDIRNLEAESWKRVNAGAQLREVQDQFEAGRQKLLETFVEDLKHYLMYDTYRERDND